MENNKKKVVFNVTGVSSGDYECPCFDVTKEEFKRLNGYEPEDFDESCFYNELYRYYGIEVPRNLISEYGEGAVLKIKATFEIEKVGEVNKKF